jgi:hypothetical protein
MEAGSGAWRTVAAAGVAICVAACGRQDAPQPQRPLDPAAQAAAAEQLASAFAGACLSEPDAGAAIQALRSRGWPAFNTVWREPTSVFYAAPPSPAGLFVIGERPVGGVGGARRLTCVGHYPATTAAPMAAAIARRWGPGRPGDGPFVGALVWTFRVRGGVVTPDPTVRGLSPAEAGRLAPDEAQVFVQVFYNRNLNDVASLIAVGRSAG